MEISNQEKRKSSSSTAWIVSIVVSLLIVAIGAIVIYNSTKDSEAETVGGTSQNMTLITDNRDTVIKEYASAYCANHKDDVITFDDPNYPSNDGSGFTNRECEKIIGILYDNNGEVDDIEKVVNSKIWVGMDETEVWYSIGSPDDINITNYGGLVTKQLVYGHNYVYTDKNDVVTSYQLYN